MCSKLAYHGTPCLEVVLREGLRADKSSEPWCPHIWLARKPEDAAHFGDVIVVDMEGIAGDFENGEWQGCYHGGDLGPERLSLLDRPRQ